MKQTMKPAMVIVLFCACVAGCGQHVNTHRLDISKIVWYQMDDRTGLCFARLGVDADYEVFSIVPCSPSVMKLIKSGDAHP